MGYDRGMETRFAAQAPDAPYASLGKSAYDLEGSETAQSMSALERTGYVMDSSRALAARVERMVAKFIGATPECDGVEACTGGPGLFHQLHRVSDETGYAIRKANEALDRLEKELA